MKQLFVLLAVFTLPLFCSCDSSTSRVRSSLSPAQQLAGVIAAYEVQVNAAHLERLVVYTNIHAASSVIARDSGQVMYTVTSGDNLSKIAIQHGTTVNGLRWANDLNPNKLKVGQQIRITPRPRQPMPGEIHPVFEPRAHELRETLISGLSKSPEKLSSIEAAAILDFLEWTSQESRKWSFDAKTLQNSKLPSYPAILAEGPVSAPSSASDVTLLVKSAIKAAFFAKNMVKGVSMPITVFVGLLSGKDAGDPNEDRTLKFEMFKLKAKDGKAAWEHMKSLHPLEWPPQLSQPGAPAPSGAGTPAPQASSPRDNPGADRAFDAASREPPTREPPTREPPAREPREFAPPERLR